MRKIEEELGSAVEQPAENYKKTEKSKDDNHFFHGIIFVQFKFTSVSIEKSTEFI